MGDKKIPLKTKDGIEKCITFKSSSVVKPLISMQKVVRAGNVVVLDGNNPHIRNIRDGTTIKLDSNNGVYTIKTCGFVHMKRVQFSDGRDSEWSRACKVGSIV